MKLYKTRLWQFSMYNRFDFCRPNKNNLLRFFRFLRFPLTSQNKIGEDITIFSFLKGVFRLMSSAPKYIHTWDATMHRTRLVNKILSIERNFLLGPIAKSGSFII